MNLYRENQILNLRDIVSDISKENNNEDIEFEYSPSMIKTNSNIFSKRTTSLSEHNKIKWKYRFQNIGKKLKRFLICY